jgi:hypothetical protein
VLPTALRLTHLDVDFTGAGRTGDFERVIPIIAGLGTFAHLHRISKGAANLRVGLQPHTSRANGLIRILPHLTVVPKGGRKGNDQEKQQAEQQRSTPPRPGILLACIAVLGAHILIIPHGR